MKDKRRVIPFRRKREGKTNYKKRIAFLTSEKPRLVIRKSLKNITAQIVIYEPKGDKVIASACSAELTKLGWKFSGGNIPAAYLVGFLAGKKAKTAKIGEAIADVGLYQPIKGSKLYAVLKGAIDAGLSVPHDETSLPKAERINGKHIADYKKIDIVKNFDDVLSKMKGK
ncbi:MAG: 50S ribosomal protein L18 [Nanoarchaeota archaeon]